MASDKKPKKANKSKYVDPKTGECRHRGGASAKDVVKHKRRTHEYGGLPPEVPPAE